MMPSHNRRTRHLHALGLGGPRRAAVLGRDADHHAPLQDAEDYLALLDALVGNDGLGEHKANGHVGAEHVRRERLDHVHHLVGALAADRRAELSHLPEVRAVHLPDIKVLFGRTKAKFTTAARPGSGHDTRRRLQWQTERASFLVLGAERPITSQGNYLYRSALATREIKIK